MRNRLAIALLLSAVVIPACSEERSADTSMVYDADSSWCDSFGQTHIKDQAQRVLVVMKGLIESYDEMEQWDCVAELYPVLLRGVQETCASAPEEVPAPDFVAGSQISIGTINRMWKCKLGTAERAS